jgi:hypothetical protein
VANPTYRNPFAECGHNDVLAIEPITCLNCAETEPACNWTIEWEYPAAYLMPVAQVVCPSCFYPWLQGQEIKREWGFV